MAKYDWGDGRGKVHTISLAEHHAHVAAQATIGTVTSRPGQGATFTNPAGAQPGFTAQPAAAPAAPAAGTPATTPAAATITPDAQFIAEAAQRAFARTTQLNAFTKEGTDDKTNTATTINRLIENAVQDRGNITTGAAKEGLFYSGQLTKRLDDYERALKRGKDDATTEYTQRQAAREAAIKAIQEGAPLEEAVGMAEAGQRQVGRDTAAADLGALVPNVNAGPSSTAVPKVVMPKVVASKPQPAAAYQVKRGSGGVWHIYPNGRKVWVPTRR